MKVFRVWLGMPQLPWKKRVTIRFPEELEKESKAASNFRQMVDEVLNLDYECWIQEVGGGAHP